MEKRGKREQRVSIFGEIIAENFPTPGKELDIHVQEPNRTPYLNAKKDRLQDTL